MTALPPIVPCTHLSTVILSLVFVVNGCVSIKLHLKYYILWNRYPIKHVSTPCYLLNGLSSWLQMRQPLNGLLCCTSMVNNPWCLVCFHLSICNSILLSRSCMRFMRAYSILNGILNSRICHCTWIINLPCTCYASILPNPMLAFRWCSLSASFWSNIRFFCPHRMLLQQWILLIVLVVPSLGRIMHYHLGFVLIWPTHFLSIYMCLPLGLKYWHLRFRVWIIRWAVLVHLLIVHGLVKVLPFYFRLWLIR